MLGLPGCGTVRQPTSDVSAVDPRLELSVTWALYFRLLNISIWNLQFEDIVPH